MSSEFNDLLAAGFDEMINQVGTQLAVGVRTANCVLSGAPRTRDLRDTGVWDKVSNVAELTRADFATLEIEDRSGVTIGGERYVVMSIDNDPSDPCVRLRLMLSHARA